MGLLERIKSKIVIRKKVVYECTNIESLNLPKIREACKIVMIDDENVSRIMEFRGEKVLETFKKHLKERQNGVYAIKNSKAIGHAWAIVCEQNTFLVNNYFKLHNNEALIHYCNVQKAYRGKNVFSCMLHKLCEYLLNDLNIEKIFIDADINNKASIRGIEKVGFSFVSSNIYFNIWGKLIFSRRKN